MKRKFLVEIDYNELDVNKNMPVLSSAGVGVTIENMMEGYLETKSIEKDYQVNVTETTEDK